MAVQSNITDGRFKNSRWDKTVRRRLKQQLTRKMVGVIGSFVLDAEEACWPRWPRFVWKDYVEKRCRMEKSGQLRWYYRKTLCQTYLRLIRLRASLEETVHRTSKDSQGHLAFFYSHSTRWQTSTRHHIADRHKHPPNIESYRQVRW